MLLADSLCSIRLKKMFVFNGEKKGYSGEEKNRCQRERRHICQNCEAVKHVLQEETTEVLCNKGILLWKRSQQAQVVTSLEVVFPFFTPGMIQTFTGWQQSEKAPLSCLSWLYLHASTFFFF